MRSTHALLLKAVVGDSDDATVLRWLVELRQSLGIPLVEFAVCRGVRTPDLYAYGELDGVARAAERDLRRFETLARRVSMSVEASPTIDRLERAFVVPGASAGAIPVFHYVVETDAADGWEPEIFQWYDTEHMPGLAAVPGCVRAQRFLNPDGGPHSLACYDLTDSKTLESASWLAVRHTAWSDRVRPQFRNTRRTMFRALPG